MTTLKKDVMALTKKGAHADAINLALNATRLTPDSSVAWHSLAYAYERSKNLNAAIDAANTATQLAPSEPALWFHMGWLNLKVDNSKECLNDMEQVLAKSDAAQHSYYQETAAFLAAEALRRLRRYAEALSMCQQVRDSFALYLGKPLSKEELVQSCNAELQNASLHQTAWAMR